MAKITIEIVELEHERKWTIEYWYDIQNTGHWHASSIGGQYIRYDTMVQLLQSSLIPELVRKQLRIILKDSLCLE